MITTEYHTYKEIFQQPDLWVRVFDLVQSQKEDLQKFIQGFLEPKTSEIIFTGAGSSFFIGEMVAGVVQNQTGVSCRAISTTEILTHPSYHINKPFFSK